MDDRSPRWPSPFTSAKRTSSALSPETSQGQNALTSKHDYRFPLVGFAESVLPDLTKPRSLP